MAEAAKPNILVIWGDDIGITNLSCYSDGLMGYRTPNIDRIADEGMRFTDSYGEQSCTAGRSSFITGQSVFRTGLSKVGVPGRRRRPPGRGPDDRRAAEAARLRDGAVRQEPPRRPATSSCRRCTASTSSSATSTTSTPRRSPSCPTTRRPTTSRSFRERFGPRGVLHCWATDEDDATEEPRWGRVGKQRIEDTGPLTKKRMETIDDEFARARDRLHRPRRPPPTTPFFVWFNTTHMHLRTHPKPESMGQAGRWQSPYHDTMIDHDKIVGALLDKLDELGHRREHDRDLLDRQRPAHEHVAGRRHDARSAARRTRTGRAPSGFRS